MYITDLALNDFRSYREAVMSFDPGVVTFIGDNGQGKTNIVEALHYLATFSSHRVANDGALIRFGAGAGVIRARVQRGGSSTMVEVEIRSGGANRARINRGQVRPADVLGIVHSVVFAPEDLQLVTGDPGARRRFVDSLLVQVRPKMAGVRADYDKVMRQRGALLKTLSKNRRRGAAVDTSTLTVWDEQVANLGAQIIAARARMIALLRPPMAQYYTAVSAGRSTARIDYLANIDERSGWQVPAPHELAADDTGVRAHEESLMDVPAVAQRLRDLLHDYRDQEIARGVNLVGPHRDDARLSIGDLPAKGYASHGESWSCALALKLASWQVLSEEGDEPILILDDVFAELDSQRRTELARIVTRADQVFVTAAIGNDLPEGLGGQRFRVREGTVTPERP